MRHKIAHKSLPMLKGFLMTLLFYFMLMVLSKLSTMNLYLFSNQLFTFICLTSCICYAWYAQYNFLIYNPKILIKHII